MVMKPNTWAMLCHLIALVGFLGNGLGWILGPLVVWIVKKDEMQAVDLHGKESINFNITVLLYYALLTCFAVITLGFGLILTIPLAAVLLVFHVACIIVAAIKANDGEFFRYPFCIRLLK